VDITPPPRGETVFTDVLTLGPKGVIFRTIDLCYTSNITDFIGTTAIEFSYIWVKGIKFFVFRSRESAKFHEYRTYLCYGKEILGAKSVYGPVIITGQEDGNRIRSLTEFEKNVLWDNVRFMTVNRGTQDKPVMEFVARLCFAEDNGGTLTAMSVDGSTQIIRTMSSAEDAVLGPV
jgi:hypothetical protein